MVGTFYRAPQPGSPPFVEEGDVVAAGPDALHPRGDEADERGEGGPGGGRPPDPRRERRSRSSSARCCSTSSRSSGRPLDAGRCSRASSLRTAARSPCASSARCTSSASRPSPSTRPPTSDALHVRLADRAVRIGPPPARAELPAASPRSSPPRRRPAARPCIPATASSPRTTTFVHACEDNDLVFIGPPADVMARMGDKAQAKIEMRAAGVPLVPGTEGIATLAAGARRGGRARLSRCC